MLIKTLILFYSKKVANSSKYIHIMNHKEKYQVDLNRLRDSQYKIKELTEKIAYVDLFTFHDTLVIESFLGREGLKFFAFHWRLYPEKS